MTTTDETRGTTGAPRRIYATTRRVTDALEPFTWPMIRVVAGLNLVPHGYPKVFDSGLANVADSFAKMGYEPGWLWGPAVAVTEVAGGIMLAVGLLTRPVALAIAVFLFTAVVHHWGAGFYWNKGGFEYPLFWGVVALAFAIRGGGRYSVDRLIGREF